MNFRQLLVLLFVLFSATAVLAVTSQASMKIFAVTSEGKGLSADLTLKILPNGSGKVWSSVVPLVGTTTQNAELVAVRLAKNYSPEVDNFDYLFEIKSQASVVEGPSAGSAMALLTVASLQNKAIPAQVGMTGTISEDGTIGPVGGVFEKSQEAAKIGIKLFMIPKGEAKQTVKLPSGVQNISLPDYALKEWGMKVIEVDKLDTALKLAFSDISKIDVNKTLQQPQLVFVPKPIGQASSLAPLQRQNSKFLSETKDLINSARNSLSTTLINDTSVINSLLSQLGDTEDALKEAQTLNDANYLYSSANYTFLARVNALTIKDIAENPSILSDNSTVLKVKVQNLQEKVKALEEEIDKGIPTNDFEWYAAAQQRLTWARINLEQLAQPETIIVINGVQQTDSTTAVKKVQDFEFAQAWFDIAVNFYDFGSNSEKWASLNDFLKPELSAAIIKAENGLSINGASEKEDITRRVNSAKIEQAFKWNLGGYFDAVSAQSLLDAESAVNGKDANALESILVSKIAALDSQLKDLNFKPVWANLYLDHARYYLNGAKFYQQNGQAGTAAEMLKSGVSLAFLAESNLNAAKLAFAHYSIIPDSELVNIPRKQPLGVNVTVTQDNTRYLFLIIFVLGVGLLASVVLIILIVRKRSKGVLEVHEFGELSKQQKRLAQDYAVGKISAQEFLEHSKKLSESISKIETSAKSKSHNTVELDYLHSKSSGLEHSIRVLKRDYAAGKILEEDYQEALRQIGSEIKRLNDSLTDSGKPKPIVAAKTASARDKSFSSTALNDIASQIKKPSKVQARRPLQKKKKKR
ncbi:MAG: S16 family serine protease [Candidatus Diapherotrites archaeon]|nr:S16 family serine protease [Candidatus Diapherotrites archaeon]